jgi:hypothetical protein
MQIRPITNRLRSLLITGTSVVTSVVFLGHISQQTG